MHRPILRFLLVGGAVGLLAAACGGGGKTVAPTAETVEGTLPTATTGTETQEPLPEGDAAAGKPLFAAQGCNGCHTYAPAGSNASVGPNLDNLEQDAQEANRGSVEEYAHESLVDPNAYVVPGFQPTMPSYDQLSQKQLADLVAFLTNPS